MNEKHDCDKCFWNGADGCIVRFDENGFRLPVYDEPTECDKFISDDELFCVRKGE